MTQTYTIKHNLKWATLFFVASGALFAQTNTIDLDTVGIHLSRGHVLYRKGDFNRAIAEYRQAIQLDPKQPAAHRGLAMVLVQQGNLKGAIGEFRERARLAPLLPISHVELADALFRNSDWDGAVQEYRQAILLRPQDAQLHESLGEALEEKGDRQSALAEFKSANTYAPADPTIRGSYIRLFSELNPGAKPEIAVRADEPPEDGIYRPGRGVTAPVAVYNPQPSYTDQARQKKLSGAIILSVVVDENGQVTDVHVEKSLGLGLDENAVDAVKTWKFEPGMHDGKPVPVRVRLEVTFKLY